MRINSWITFWNRKLPLNALILGYYCTTRAADDLVNPNLVVPDSVTKAKLCRT
ncbi:MAG: hypothetical protein ACLRMZ_22410 [Blautia marasmi]